MDPIEEVGSKINYGTPLKKKKIKSSRRPGYMQQPVDLQKTPFLFFPPGKEILFMGIYFVTLPYITGQLFIFFYISDANAKTFGDISVNSNFFLVWALGYEILAAVIVLWIIKNAISFSIKNHQAQTVHPNRRHKKHRY